MENNQPHIFYQIKELDPDRAFLSLFAPDNVRMAVQVLDLWNAEISRIREEVHEPHMGLIRLQWWRDEIKRICGGGRSDNHPVLSLLSDIIPANGFSFGEFDKILRAREMEYEGQAPENIEELLSYIDGTHGELMKMKGMLLGSSHSYLEIARTYSLVGLVRAVPFHASIGHMMMPQLNISDIQPHSQKLGNVVRSICSIVSPKKADHKYMKATAAMAGLYSKEIERAGFDPFHIRSVPFKELRVWLKAF